MGITPGASLIRKIYVRFRIARAMDERSNGQFFFLGMAAINWN